MTYLLKNKTLFQKNSLKIQEIKRLRDLLIDETSEDFFQKITGDLKEVIIKNNLCRSPAVVEDLFQFVLKVLFFSHYLDLPDDTTLK